MQKYYDTSLDSKLNSIPTLSWIPWIGENYLKKTSPRTLIISESHYEWKQEENDQSASDYLKDKNFTRDFLESRALNFLIQSTFENPKIFKNFEKTILDSENPPNEQKQKLWLDSAYYTFVQRAMKAIEKRPTGDDFSIGWKNFVEVVKVLKPDVCIFLGTSSIGGIYGANEIWRNENIIIPDINRHGKINGAIPRTVTIEIEQQPIKIIALKHPSMAYNWKEWVSFLKQELF